MKSLLRKLFACVANASTEAQLADARTQIADLEDLLVEQGEIIDNLGAAFRAADHLLDVLLVRNGDGEHLISFTIGGDEKVSQILRNAIWDLESKVRGVPCPPPLSIEGTIH